MTNTFKGLLPDGHLPSVAKAEVIKLISEESPPPDLSGYATKEELSQVAPTAEAVAKAMGFALVTGEVEPAPTLYGVPVVWLDTKVKRDPSAWPPVAPVFDVGKRSYTIPEDEGAEYLVDGAVKTKGTYTVTPPATVRITTRAKNGYTLAGTTEWAQTFEENVSAYEVVALALKPEHYWRMDDLSGVPKDRGTAPISLYSTGTAQYGVAGIGVGPTAISASGSRHAFQIGNFLPAGATAYTMAAAVKGSGGLFSDWNQKNRLGITIATNTLDAAGPTASAQGALVDTAKVNHIALTYDGSMLRTYLNGAEVGSKTEPGPVATSPALTLGRDGLTFAGVVLDTKRAFSAAEIKKLSDAVVR